MKFLLQYKLYGFNLQGSPMDQRKIEMHAEIDRLADERCLSYNEAADICLKVVGPEKKLFNASAGMLNECVYIYLYLCPLCVCVPVSTMKL